MLQVLIDQFLGQTLVCGFRVGTPLGLVQPFLQVLYIRRTDRTVLEEHLGKKEIEGLEVARFFDQGRLQHRIDQRAFWCFERPQGVQGVYKVGGAHHHPYGAEASSQFLHLFQHGLSPGAPNWSELFKRG